MSLISPTRWPSLTWTIFVVLISASYVYASYGDRLFQYRDCVSDCISIAEFEPLSIPVHRHLLFWSTQAECSYTCQHQVTASRAAQGLPIVQFHGKWPFYRFLGIQEPFSVLFSLMNLAAHYHGSTRLAAIVPARHPIRKYYIGLSSVAILGWSFSAIFHARDFSATERLDYFGAAAMVLYGLWYAVVRLMGWEDSRFNRSALASVTSAGQMGARYTAVSDGRQRTMLKLWTRMCVVLYACHVGYLSLWKWDYEYNMVANVVIGVLGNVCWITYSIRRYRFVQKTAPIVINQSSNKKTDVGNPSSAAAVEDREHQSGSSGWAESAWPLWAIFAVMMIMSAMALELFDFPPVWGMVDAHALWHLGTVLPTCLWYGFLVRDAMWDVKLGLVPNVVGERGRD